MPPLGGLGGILQRQTGEALAFGLGFALGRALEPAGVELAQEAWKIAPIRAPDAGMMAAGLAQGQVDKDQAAGWAREHGYDGEAFAAMVEVATTGPAIGTAMQAWRRGELSDQQFRTVLRRAAIEERWFEPIMALKEERLDPGAIATAIHRGIMAGEGTIIREPPRTPGRIPQVPRSEISGVEEAAAHGYDAERLRVLVGNTGLPPGLEQMLALLNRGEVTEDDVRRAVAQSNLRNEYMDAVLELRRQLPTARDFLENALRGYRSLAEAIDGAALHGMSAEDATMIYQNQGRPMALRQITQALARGGKFEPEPGEIRDPYRAAIVEGNLKPAYYDLALANRYTLPGAFVIRGMAAAGELTGKETEQLLLESGWKPDLAAKAAKRWAAAGPVDGKRLTVTEALDSFAGGTLSEGELRDLLAAFDYSDEALELMVHLADARRIKRYREKVTDAIAGAYTAFKIDAATATSELAEIGIAGKPAGDLVALWTKQRRFTIRTLTAAQVKKAHGKGLITRDEALEALEDLHYTPEDARILLDS